jgi:hypothetical protein
MGVLDRLRGHNKVQEADDMATPAYANTAINSVMQPRSPSERADRRDKGIDIDMIDAEEVVHVFEQLAFYYEPVPVQAQDKDGNLIFTEVPALDGNGNTVYTDVPYTTPSGVVLMKKEPVMVKQPVMTTAQVLRERPWALSILVLLNKTWPTIWMSPSVANNKRLLFRTLFYDIRESMTVEERQRWGVVVNTAEAFCTARLEDCKDGHKPLLLKVESHKLEVSTNRGLTNNGKQ